jgi:hypothetical protein
MLGSQLFATYKSEYERVIDTLGVQAVWARPSASVAGKTVTVGSRIAADKDDAIVNAYGIGALIFTFKAIDFPVGPPLKFDTLTIGTETHVIDHVSPVHMNGSIFGYRCYARGK